MSWQLAPHPGGFPGVPGPVVVCVLDGIGIGRRDAADAVWLARTPHLDRLAAASLFRPLRAHGTAVGMPSDDDMGNSEVGHNTLGAGRSFDQGAKLVSQAIASGDLFAGPVWKQLITQVRGSGGTLHAIGLLSDGNVHSHIDHLFALIRQSAAEGVERLRVHVLLDGRDVPATSALDYVDPLEALLAELRAQGRDYCIASGGGRMVITMDRYEADWGMVERGYRAHVHGEARGFPSARAAIETFREEQPGISDQVLPPFAIVDGAGQPVGPIRDGAGVILLNFRGDRAIELCRAFEEDSFSPFDRGRRPELLFAGMLQYDGDRSIPERFLVAPPAIDRTLGEYLARNGVPQLALSETQKYGHVTYFWNGNRSGRFDDRSETYVEIPSDTLPVAERPWMKAAEITDRALTELATGRYRHARLNYANGDMVGHTGDRDATIVAVEAVDIAVGRLAAAVSAWDGALIVTADHGNADEMFEESPGDGAARPKTSHSCNPVPCSIYAPGAPSLALASDLHQPGLANIAATVLQLLGHAAPEGYGASLLAG